jgi:hypothetical protein
LTETVPPCLVKIDPPGKYDVQRLVIAAEDMFDICLKIHKNVGYQGRQGMEKEAKKFYYNVTRPIIELFLQYSSEYQTKRKKTVNHGLVVKPIISENFNSRGQNDLVDMHSLPDGDIQFRLGHISGIFKECVSYNVLEKISDKSCTLTIDKVPKDKKVSVREAVKAVSIAGGQGVKACGCISGNCNIGKCVCLNMNQ